MTQTLARIKKAGKNFEIIVDLNDALRFKKGEISSIEAEGDKIFTDSKKGQVPSSSDLSEAFGTTDSRQIIETIVKNGKVQSIQEHRDAEQEQKFKQVVDLLSRITKDPQTGNPHTPERIKSALEQAHVNIKNSPIENQIKEIVEQISRIIPVKMDTQKVEIIIPAVYTGQAYGLISPFKEEEKWLDNGDLQVKVNLASGTQMSFYDKLNSITHGAALTKEIKEND